MKRKEWIEGLITKQRERIKAFQRPAFKRELGERFWEIEFLAEKKVLQYLCVLLAGEQIKK